MPPEENSSAAECPEASAAARAYRARSTSSRAMGTRRWAPTCSTLHRAGTAPAWMAAALHQRQPAAVAFRTRIHRACHSGVSTALESPWIALVFPSAGASTSVTRVAWSARLQARH